MNLSPIFQKYLLAFFLIFVELISLPANQLDKCNFLNREGVNLAKEGKYLKALAALEEACQMNPFDESAISNLSCVHNNLGVILMGKQAPHEALNHFRAASMQKPEDIQIRFNLVSALMLQQLRNEARQELFVIQKLRPKDPKSLLKVANAFKRLEDQESALEALYAATLAAPQDFDAHFQLAKHFAETGNLSEAKYHLNVARESRPKRQECIELAKLLQQEQQLANSFDTEKGVHFEVHYEERFTRSDALMAMEHLEDAYLALGAVLGHYPHQRTQVFLCVRSSLQSFQELPDWAGGVYDGKIRIPVPDTCIDPTWIRAAVFHEYTHHVVYLLAEGKCPAWLNEGLAQFMEGRSLEDAKATLRNSSTYGIKRLAHLTKSFSSCKTRKEAATKYAQSLVGTSILMEQTGPHAIKQILDLIGQNLSTEAAIKKITQISFQELEVRIEEIIEG